MAEAQKLIVEPDTSRVITILNLAIQRSYFRLKQEEIAEAAPPTSTS